MKKYRVLSLLLLLCVLTGLVVPVPTHAIEEMKVEASYAVLVDAHHGEVLFEQNGRDKAYPASITKVMTALLVVEAIERGEIALDQMVTCSESAHEGLVADGSTQDIQPGESMSVRDLLYCLLVASANETGNILAEAVCGDVDTFVAQMNRRAGELGCENTHFVNTHGLHDDDHYTTAYDITLFFGKAMEYELFQKIVGSWKYETAATERKEPRKLYNTNALISTWNYTSYYYDKCIGGKTGTTGQAGRCLVSAAEKGDEYLIAVVLDGPYVTMDDGIKVQKHFTESKRLFEWGFENFQRKTLSPEGSFEAAVKVTLSEQTDEVLVRPDGVITRTVPVDLSMENMELTVRLFSDTVEAPVAEGQLMGTLTLSYEGEEYGTLDLVALTSVERSEFLAWKMAVQNFFTAHGMKVLFAAAAVIFLLVALRVAIGRNRKKHWREAPRKGSGSYGARRR